MFSKECPSVYRYREALEKIISLCQGKTWQEEAIIRIAREALDARRYDE